MIGTGFFIGCVSSVKWVGFFVTSLVGLLTIEELWNMLGESRLPKKTFLRHFGSRVFGLIVVPLVVYALSFMVHFAILNRSGPGDANMSSLFQAKLTGNDLAESPVELAYGSYLTLKSNNYGGGLLHSHVQGYPSGSKQQQVTTYHHKDANNLWRIVRPFNASMAVKGIIDYDSLPIEPIRDGDLIRLQHNNTGHVLHSHQIPAPLTKDEYEVSGYGRLDYDDANDLWRVEIMRETVSGPAILRTLSTRFRLRHVRTGCWLKSRNKALPEWGFRQGEVTCDKEPDFKANYLLWNVEYHENKRLAPGNASMYQSRFIDDFWDCNVGMYITNNALVPDEELEPGQLVSKAKDWFLMKRGIRMSSWADDRVKFYMLGNPAVWWSSSAAIIILGVLLGAYILIKQRQEVKLLPSNYDNFLYKFKVAVGGWALTYLPFFVMGRVLYLHHYYPALIFAVLATGFLFDHLTSKRSERTQRIVGIGCMLLVLATFIYFSPMCYGITGPGKAFRGRRWLKSWNL